jgi:phosphate transport system substrate-binding protein
MNKRARWWPVRVGIVLAVMMGMLVVTSAALARPTINGAGATAPQLLYSRWAAHYSAAKINYNGVGSGSGITQITNGTVNFGASDKPLTRSTLDASPGLVQFPSCIEGVVPIVNISGVASGRLKLSGAVLAKIYEGTITTWNNSAIKALNPGLKLPATKIHTVHRSDSSGTTWIFTHYLKAVDSSWGFTDMSGRWPGNNAIGMAKSAGVAAKVKTLSGAIGYVEYSYALTAHIPYAQMKNKSGKWVLPSESTFAAAGAHAAYTWSNGFATSLVNMAGNSAWPISGETYIIVRRSQGSYATGNAMLKFFDWAFTSSQGVKDAKALDFVPLPTVATKAIRTVWHANVKSGSKPCW